MPRRVEDIRPGERRSIRDIPVEPEKKPLKKAEEPSPALRKKAEEPSSESRMKDDVRKFKEAQDKREGSLMKPIHIQKMPTGALPIHKAPSKGRVSKRTKGIALIAIGVCLLIGVIGYFASANFSRAAFTLYPKIIPITVNSPIMVFGAPQNGQLSYELFSESTIASTSVPATDAPGVQSKASGSIIIYNTYSAQPWRLIAGTRLVNDIGNTYRLTSSVTIPGYKKPAGGALTPGKIAVSIIADQSGSQYNISRLDAGNTFTIPAYASSTKFAAIYGKSTGNITGGLSGSKKSISPAALASTTEALRSVAVSSLTARLKGKISAEYVVYDSAYVSKASVPTISGDKPKSAIVSTEVTVYAIALKKVDLILKLAGAQSLQIFSGSTFDPVGLTSLSFSITNIKDFMPEKKSNILVQMKGDLKLVGVIPVEEMKGEFAGISLSDTQKVMLKHSAVIDLEKSSGQVVPPWAKIPKDKSKIDITVQK